MIGLALDAAGDRRARKEAAQLLEKKAKITDADAYWAGNYDGLLDYWDDTSPETTAFALKLLIRQDRVERPACPRRRMWLAKHRDGDYWYSTKQTAMVIEGLTDYLALSGELANSSDVEVLVNGTSVGKRHFGPGDGFALPWKIKVPAAQVGRRRPGHHPQERQRHHLLVGGERVVLGGQEALPAGASWRSTSPATTTCCRRSKPSPPTPSPTTWFRSKGPVHVGDIVAVQLAVNGTDWKYLLAEDPIPAGTEFLRQHRPLHAEQQARLVGRLVYAQGVPR